MSIKDFGVTVMTVGAAIITLLTFALAAWWLVVVRSLLDKPPQIENGVIVLDQFQRAKDILLVVFPLFSAAVAYWIGSKEVNAMKEQRNAAERRLLAVVDVAPSGTLIDAQQRYPDAFT
jgi:hypothetical protein